MECVCIVGAVGGPCGTQVMVFAAGYVSFGKVTVTDVRTCVHDDPMAIVFLN